MMNRFLTNNLFVLLIGAMVFIASCGDDEPDVVRVFESGFSVSEGGISATGESITIEIAFTEPTLEEATATISVTETGVTYGTEYTTDPVATSGQLEVVIPAQAENASFTVSRIADVYDEGAAIEFSLVSVEGATESADIVTESATFTLSFNEVVATGGIIDFETGGASFPNQAYIDLSKITQTNPGRDTWELAFSSADDNKVYLNSSLLVTAAELAEFTDIDAVTSTTAFATPFSLYTYNFGTGQSDEVIINGVTDLMAGIPVSYSQYYYQDYSSFTDSQDGTSTAITPVSLTADENKVYLICMGNEVPEDPDVDSGGIQTTGDLRGFYKIRILSDGNTYTLQYAEIDDTSHSEVTITKDAAFNHTFFSLANDEEVNVEPAKDNWDINMSGVFSFFTGGFGLTYSDYMLHNTFADVALYTVYLTDDDGNATGNPVYEDFSIDDVVPDDLDGTNRAVVGSGWRNASSTSGYFVKDDRYFVVEDAEGNFYKFKFTRLLSDEGDRGNAQMQYDLLQ